MEQTYEQEIDLKDLLFFILHKWRIVLLTVLVLSVLFGGYKLGRGLFEQQNERYIADVQKQYETYKKDYEQKKETYEKSIQKLSADIKYAEAYQEDSVLQKIDPYNKWVASADVFIKMEDIPEENKIKVYDSDPADSVLKAYESAVKKGSEIQKFSKIKGLDFKYLKELIRVLPDYQSNMLTITATDIDEAGAQEILNVILENLKNIYPEVQSNLGDHSIVILNQNLSTKADIDLAGTQKNNMENLTSMRQNLEEVEAKVETLKEPEEPATLSSKGLLRSGFKYGILGGVMGGFLACFIASILFYMNSKVYNSDELKTRFGVNILGSFTKEKKKRAFSRVDSWLDKLEGKKFVSDAVVFERISANVKNYTVNNQMILLTGTVEADEINKVARDLKERLPDIRFETAMDMNKYPKTLNKLPNTDGIILIEEIGVSKYNDIQLELETITSIKKKVIGCIIL